MNNNLTDFNDLHVAAGLDEVRMQVMSAIEKMKESNISPAPPLGAPDIAGEDDEQAKAGRYSLETLFQSFSYIYGTKDCWDGVTGQRMELSHLKYLVGGERYKMWMESEGRKIVQGIRFEPALDLGPDYINLFTGWPLKPEKGDCRLILQHIQRLCGGRSQEYMWLLNWLAYPLQHPGSKMASAVIVHGSEGTGKSITFDEIMGRIYGHYKTTIGQQQLESSFTEWQSKKLFVLAEEVVARSERNQFKGVLKHLVTGSTLQIDQKHMSLRDETNHMNLVFLSNSTIPLELDTGDRRYMVLYVDDVPPAEYFKALFEEINNGGVEAFFDFLLNMDLGDFNPHTKPPLNQEKQNLIGGSMTSPVYFFNQWRDGELEIPFGCATSSALYRYFTKWCEQNGEYKRTQRYFSGELQRVMTQGRFRFSYPEINYPAKQFRVFVAESALGNLPANVRVDDAIGDQCRKFNLALGAVGVAADE